MASEEQLDDGEEEQLDDGEEDFEGFGEPNGNNETARKKRSKYWTHFTEIVVSGTKFAQCKLCIGAVTRYKLSGSCNSSSGNMKKHLKGHHPAEFFEIENSEQDEAPFVSQNFPI